MEQAKREVELNSGGEMPTSGGGKQQQRSTGRRLKRKRISDSPTRVVPPRRPRLPSFAAAATATTTTTVHTNTNLTNVVMQILQKKACTNQINFVCSPLSLDALLNMVAAGTKGHTLEKLLDFLGSKSIEELNSKSMKIMDVACKRGPSKNRKGCGSRPITSFVNGVWADKRFSLVPSYQQLVSRVYKAETKVVDFQKKADEVAHEVNSWVKDASRGLITNIFSPRSVSSATAIILANGLYFKGTWSHEFDTERTKNRDFYLLNGATVSVPFMTNCRDKYLYRSFEGFKVLKISYQSGKKVLDTRFAMYFFLPDARDGLQDLLKEFESNPGFLQQDLNLKLVRPDKIWIPKFKFSCGFDFCDEMRDLGHSLPFEGNSADFKEMVHIPEGLPFFISNMFHKAFIAVDEKGTKAAAISALMVVLCAKRCLTERPSFIADHPFMFMVKEEMSKVVYFTGAVVNPTLHN